MCRNLVLRGPDEDGFFLTPDVGLAMRWLSVIELETLRQSISNEIRDILIVFKAFRLLSASAALASRGNSFPRQIKMDNAFTSRSATTNE
jgi:hypothetical protein